MENRNINQFVFVFKSVSEQKKDEILLTCIRNDSRYFAIQNNFGTLQDWHQALFNATRKQTMAMLKIAENSDFVGLYREVRNYVEREYTDRSVLLQSIYANFLLRENGVCPMLNYAFDKWCYPDLNASENTILELAEISITYLYRLILVKTSRGCSEISGAYGEIKLMYDGTLVKTPMNLAAFLFANEEEWENYQTLSATELANYIPKPISFNCTTKKIKRECITGLTGHEILKAGLMDDLKVVELKIIFGIIQKIQQSFNIRLDIHPGNFIWDEELSQWFLFDLGPVPNIGFDYYPNSFQEYFQKVWKERLERMHLYPIRSVWL